MPTPLPICSDCRWRKPIIAKPGYNQCMLMPPELITLPIESSTSINTDFGIHSIRPVTFDSDYCSKFQHN